MKFEVTQDLGSLEQRYLITISYNEWVEAKFHSMDKTLFEECDKSEKVSDKLLGLETLVRRIEESK